MLENNLDIKDFTRSDAKCFRNYLQSKLQKNTVNNIKCVIVYGLDGEFGLLSNAFAKLFLYEKQKFKSNKRNFTLEELKQLFSGEHNIEKEVLDALRFILLTGMRIGEFYSLNADSFSKDGKWVKVQTEKIKPVEYREMPIHKAISDLSDFKSFKRLLTSHKSLNAINKKLNRAIDKISKDKTISVHRPRGTFVAILDDYLQNQSFVEQHQTLKQMCGHKENKFEKRLNIKMTERLAGYTQDITHSAYSKSSNRQAKLLAIRAFDGIDEIFEYLNKKSHKKLKNRKYTKRKLQEHKSTQI